MIYLDNTRYLRVQPAQAAGSGKGHDDGHETMASPGRGGHEPAAKAADTAFRCREELSEFFRAPGPEHVAFTMNATHAVNIAIATLVKPGDRVVISGMSTTPSRGRCTCLGPKQTRPFRRSLSRRPRLRPSERGCRAQNAASAPMFRTCSALYCPLRR